MKSEAQLQSAKTCEGASDKYGLVRYLGGDTKAEQHICPLLVGERRCFRPTVVLDNVLFGAPLFAVCSQHGYAFAVSEA